MKNIRTACLGMGAALALALTATAASADGYGRRSIKDAPCCEGWEGFYVGVHGGYGWKDNDFAEVFQVVPLLTLGGIDSRGSVWGGQAGHNWQRGSIVGGLEIDFSTSGIRGNSTPLVRNLGQGVSITDIVGDDVKYLGSARARLGVAGGGGCCSGLLFYATAGLAWERVDRTDTQILIAGAVTQTVINRDPRDWFGWVAGIGTEAKLGGSGWIGRIEYLHYDFGTVEQTTSVATNQANQSFSDRGDKQTIDIVRAALSYKF